MGKIELYDRIFFTANENMKKGGSAFTFSKVALECILCKEPDKLDVNEFVELNPKEYIEALYVRCLNGLPNAKAYSKMEELLVLPKGGELFAKYIFMVYVVYSAEFKSMNRKMTGMKKLRENVLINSSLSGKLYIYRKEISARIRGVAKRYLLVPMWNITPESLKKKVRSIRNRENA